MNSAKLLLSAIFALTLATIPLSPALADSQELQDPSVLWSFGINSDGQTGLGATVGNTTEPTKVGNGEDWVAISSGGAYSLLIKSDGTLWSFGSNSGGQTGLGTIVGSTIEPTQIGSDDDWLQISAGGSHSLALKEDGTLWSFGDNSNGMTGHNTDDGVTLTPTQVGIDADWSQISAGNHHSMAIKSDGTLWSFGTNSYGRTGLGTTVGDTLVPTQVGVDVDWELVSAGDSHTLAIKSDNTMWAFGANSNGQTGQGTVDGEITSPTQVGVDTDWESISASIASSFAIKSGGTLWSFGSNDRGRTGLGTIVGDTLAPTQVGSDTDWESVSAGFVHSLVIKADNSLWSFGDNDNGRTGLGTVNDNTLAPTQIGDGENWVIAAAGGSSSIVLREIIPVVEEEEEEEEPEVSSRGSSGTSVKQRVKNLIGMGKIEAAEDLKKQWPHMFEDSALITNISNSVSSTTTSTGPDLGSRDLKLNMEGLDVKQLQILLNANGFMLASAGVGSSGNETNFFGLLTQKALSRYQVAHGITPAVGYFGAITRTHMKSADLQGLWW